MKYLPLLLMLLPVCTLWGQSSGDETSDDVELRETGIGFRAGTYLTWFPRADDYDLVEGSFTTGVFGLFYRRYSNQGGVEVGLNVAHKGNANGGLSLPVIMRDFGDDDLLGEIYISLNRVGPRFLAINPQIGYILGYRLRTDGFQPDPYDDPLNRWYLMLPFGAEAVWPTNFGSVGVSASLNVGLLNVRRDPDGGNNGGSIYDGGRQRSISLQITATYGKWE